MNTHINNPFLVPTLFAGLGLLLTGQVMAQTFTPLHNFTAQSYIGTSNTQTNSDGANPWAGLILTGHTLYGTAEHGGTNGAGTVFTVNTGGLNFTNLHNFAAAATDNLGNLTNRDGALPFASLTLSGITLYGTASQGGTNGVGTIFAVNTDGTGFTNVYGFTAGNLNFDTIKFTNSDGADPQAGLVLSGTTLYGTTTAGGTNGAGTIFAINTNGTGLRLLHTFALGAMNSAHIFTNSDGVSPVGGLILSGATLYGTAEVGGTNGDGTVFAINTNGTGFTTLHTFTGNDGVNPWAGLVLSGNSLYGTTVNGGSGSRGTVFAINTNGLGFTNLYNFAALVSSRNSGGANPWAGLILSGNTLYGMAAFGGTNGSGTLFAIDTNGTANGMGFTNLYALTNTDGAFSVAGLILSDNTLYGTAQNGGNAGIGTVFSFALGSLSTPSPLLNILSSGTNVVLMWTNTATGFTLESSTNMVPPVVWNTNSTAPVIISGQNTVTNAISGSRQFYRLIK